MTDAPTLAFTDAGGELFSPAEVRSLMRNEFNRAHRYEFPLSCMMVAVDRLQYLQDLYGHETKNEILDAVAEVLRTSTRASDLLGCLVDDRLLVVIPHATAEGAVTLSRRLIESTRAMTFESGGPALKITLSIGCSHNRASEDMTFEGLVQTAETGLAVASAAGGDRLVEWREVEAEVEGLREEVDGQVEALQSLQREVEAGVPPAERGPGDDEIETGIKALFVNVEPHTSDLQRLEEDVLTYVLQKVHELRLVGGSGGDDDQIEILERRVAKLAGLLGLAEQELERVSELKDVDLGIASIYREIQGLPQGDRQFDQKKKMMSAIFEANVDLQKKLDEGEAESP